ncbi:MAG: hypothetical protein MJ166_01275 [Clostridia bacterium]|nr:hypothetical protein [Clostridia bacterium]
MKYSLEDFKKRNEQLGEEIKALENKNFKFSLFRLVVFLLLVAFVVLTIAVKSMMVIFLVLACLSLVGFILLCVVHYKSNSELKFKRILRDINEEYIARVEGDFSKLKDTGDEFIIPNHDYCIDLDVFGEESLFSLLNVSESAFGRKRFSEELLNGHINSRTNSEISTIQDAVHEFSNDVDFLQEYQAIARNGRLKSMPMALLGLKDKKDFYSSKMRIVTRVLVCLWIIPVAALLLAPKLFSTALLGVLILNLIASFVMAPKYGEFFKAVEGISRQCSALYSLFEKLESKEFKSDLIKSLLYGKDSKTKYSTGLKELSKVCNKCAYRAQPLLALVLNSVCLYDSICADKLNTWVKKYGQSLPTIIENLSTIETMMSASVVEVVFEQSSRPEFVEVSNENDNAYFLGEDILHPLLNRKTAVSNSIEIDHKIAIITGSNMSGKTTLIRTVGVMCILSYLGSYVPAKKVSLGRMRIVSSMRIVDSIKEEMSTFRAELVRISNIVNAGRENKPMLFLIDEIFRGTNSADRTDGAMEVLRSLSRPMVIGFMTTHDYALCDQAKEELDNICYYHFSEKYDDDGISFDYKLKTGMTKISNAKKLMKLVGIII